MSALLALGVSVAFLWLVAVAVLPVYAASRNSQIAGQELLAQLWAFPTEIIAGARRVVDRLRSRIGECWQAGTTRVFRGGWFPGIVIGVLVALPLWAFMLKAQAQLDVDMFNDLGWDAQSFFISKLFVVTNSLLGLCLTELVGITALLPNALADKIRKVGLVVVSAIFGVFLIAQAMLAVGRADAVQAKAFVKADQIEASAQSTELAAVGDPLLQNKAAAARREAAATRSKATSTHALNRLALVAVTVLSVTVEAATSWSVVLLMSVVYVGLVGVARLVIWAPALVLAALRLLVDRGFTIHSSALAHLGPNAAPAKAGAAEPTPPSQNGSTPPQQEPAAADAGAADPHAVPAMNGAGLGDHRWGGP